MLELVLRLGFSLAAVLGLFWLVAHLGSRRLGGSRALLHVRARQSLSRTASVAVVEVGDRVLVVGVADGGVRLLAELDPESLPATPARTDDAGEDGDDDRSGTLTAGLLPAPRRSATDRLAAAVAARLQRSAGSSPSHRAERPAALRTGTTRAGTGRTDAGRARGAGDNQALQGSVLSTHTWRQAWDAATSRQRGTDQVVAGLSDG